MSIKHNGFTFACDMNHVRSSGDAFACEPFKTDAQTERTAIAHAREAGWFIGTIRITKGAPQSSVTSMRRVLCRSCSWWIGVNW